MKSGGYTHNEGFSKERQQVVERIIDQTDQEIRAVVASAGVLPKFVPGFFPCNILGLVDQQSFFLVFTDRNTGSLPKHLYHDATNQGAFSTQAVLQFAIDNAGFENPSVIAFDKSILQQDESNRQPLIHSEVRRYVEDCIQLSNYPPLVSGYEHLKPLLEKFYKDHPVYEKNVFIGMRFAKTDQHRVIHESVCGTLGAFDLSGLRSDDKCYPDDDDLWANICVYMLGCKYGIFVFEEIDERAFNPNIPLEYGFMRAMNRRVLLLKDSRMPLMPSDITGKLYRPLDIHRISESIGTEIPRWLERDLGLHRI